MCGALLHDNFNDINSEITNDVKNLMNHLSLNRWICVIESGNVFAAKNNLNL